MKHWQWPIILFLFLFPQHFRLHKLSLNFNSSSILKQKTSLKLPTSFGELLQFKKQSIYNFFYLVAKPKRYMKHKKTHPCHMTYIAKLNSLQIVYMMHKTNFKKHNFFRTSTSMHQKKKLKLGLVFSNFDSTTTTNQHNVNYQ